MKLSSFTALAFALLTTALPAINTEIPGSTLVPTIEKSNPTVSELAVPPGAVTSYSTFGAFIPNLADSVVICTDVNCGGTCYAYALSSLTKKTCYAPQTSFLSAFLSVWSGSTPPYNAFASTSATSKCGNAYLLPINKCSALPSRAFNFFLAR